MSYLIKKLYIITLIIMTTTLIGCSKDKHEHPSEPNLDQKNNKHQEQTLNENDHQSEGDLGHEHGGQGHQGHGHEHQELSADLDKPIPQLFSATCEHNIRTHKCDECRYEVGVVKASDNLFKCGLLKKIKANLKRVTVPLSLTGEVRFDQRRVAHVSTQVEGIIRKVYIMLGDQVKPGQSLIEIESVELGEAQAAYLEAQAMLKLAKRNHFRLQTLRKEGISSEKELFKSTQELDAAQIRTDAALGKLKRLGMTTAIANAIISESSMGRLILRAPAKGMVLKMHAVAGEIARSATPLITVGDNSTLWVWADLYERDIALVTQEQTRQQLFAQVEVKAFPGEQFPGTVDFISPSMSELSRTVKIRITVPNPKKRLLAGMFARVKIILPGQRQVLTLPESAVMEDQGRSFIFVHYRNDYYVRRPVVTGLTIEGFMEINKGLKGDETVVSEGAFLMKSDVLRSKMGAGCAD